jgi:hypothetical protein
MHILGTIAIGHGYIVTERLGDRVYRIKSLLIFTLTGTISGDDNIEVELADNNASYASEWLGLAECPT